jgi:hypothetical protein
MGRDPVGPPRQPAGQNTKQDGGEEPTELVKPYIPAVPPEQADSRSQLAQGSQGPDDGRRQQTPQRAAAPSPDTSRPSETAPGGTFEDEKVTSAVLNMAAGIPTVVKVKICYSQPLDEWSAILYDDIGSRFDLKQFHWNRDTDQLDPFLAVERIPKRALAEHISKREPGTACQVYEPPFRPR